MMEGRTTMNSGKRDSSEGAVIVLAMILLVIVGLLGAGLLRITGASSVETSMWISDAQAFWAAEAGLEEAKARAWQNKVQWRKSEAFPPTEPRSWTGATARGSYRVSVTNMAGTVNPSYTIFSEGRSHGRAIAAVEMIVEQAPALSVGVFGDTDLQMQPGIDVYSYDPLAGHPPAGPSTGEASVGSNGTIDLQPGITIDGDIIAGQSTNGTTAHVNGSASSDGIVTESHIEEDPLGIIGGPLGDEFDDAMIANNNSATPLITGDRFSLRTGANGTLPGGTYFLRDINIRGNLTVSGPVTIFLLGAMTVGPGSSINAVSTPSSFRVYSRSTAGIDIQPNGSFSGLIYAPYSSEIKIRPSQDFYGVIWGDRVRLQPGEEMWIDTQLLSYNAFDVYRLETHNWREVARMW